MALKQLFRMYKVTMYNYALNNPMLMIDPDGKEADTSGAPIQLPGITVTSQRTPQPQQSDAYIAAALAELAISVPKPLLMFDIATQEIPVVGIRPTK